MSIDKIGLGCSKIGSVSGIAGIDAEKLLKTAFEKGIKRYDTANIYGQGESERLLGNLMKITGKEILVTTKAGYQMPNMMTSNKFSWLKPLIRSCVTKIPFLKNQLMKVRGAVGRQQNFQEDYILKCINNSLKSLGQDTLDEFLLHNPSSDDLSKGNIFAVLTNIKKKKLANKTGLTLSSPDDQKYIMPESEIDLVQVELNLLSKGEHFEQIAQLKNRCAVEIVVVQPFAGGKLLAPHNQMTSRLKAVAQIASKNGLNMKELALKFLLQNPLINRVLFGTTNTAHLEDNLRIAQGDKLDNRVLGELEAIFSEN